MAELFPIAPYVLSLLLKCTVLLRLRNNTFLTSSWRGDGDDADQLLYYKDEYKAPSRKVPDMEDPVDATGQLLNQHLAYDTIMNAEVRLQLGNEYVTSKVIGRTKGPDGTTLG